MKKSSFYIPPGYVATRCELVFIFLGCLVMFGVGLMMWDALVDIPPVPKNWCYAVLMLPTLWVGQNHQPICILMWSEARVNISM